MTMTRPALLRSVSPPAEGAAPRAPGGRVVPFAAPAKPRFQPRRRPEAGEPRGEILLFLGVRYERRAS